MVEQEQEIILDGVGAIEHKDECLTKKQKKYWKFVINGQTYSLWEYDAGLNVSIGMVVNMTWTENPGTGKNGPITYRNLKAIYPADPNAPQPAAQPATTTPTQPTQAIPQGQPLVDDFKKKESDKYELGMAKNNAAILFSKMLEPCESIEQVKETLKNEADYYDGLVEALFKRGKAIREKLLGY